MNRVKASIFSAIICASVACFAESEPTYKLTFEDPSNWKVKYGKDFVSIDTESPAEGKQAIKFTDNSYKRGAGIESKFFPAKRGGYLLRGKIKFIDGFGCGVRVCFYNKNKKYLYSSSINYGSRVKNHDWTAFEKKAYSPSEDTAYLKIKASAWGKVKVTFMLDDISLTYLPPTQKPHKWTPQYKIKPNETAKLTAADVVAPDGVVYPNWKRAGLQSGYPKYPKLKVNIKQFGALADDGKDDSAALEKACNFLGSKGGGILLLNEGTYHLKSPIVICHNNIFIKGRGSDKTKFISSYMPENGIEFYRLKAGETVGPETDIWIHALPKELVKMSLDIDGKYKLPAWERSMHSGNTFNRSFTLGKFADKLTKGKYTLNATAEYFNGSAKKTSIQINYDPDYVQKQQILRAKGIIMFSGKGFSGTAHLLAKDGLRGAEKLTLKDNASDLKAGDIVRVVAPPTPRWNKLVENACNWGAYRNYQIIIKKVDGKTVWLDQPLRLDFPVIDGSFIEKIESLENCGVEGFSFEQTTNIWLTSVLFQFVVNCSAKDIIVKKCGRNPVYFYFAKFCEISNCIFDDAWFKGGGGTAYVGWERCYDCLMTDVKTYKMRHAPLFQWSASGNVIRKGEFIDSDAQWHSGWTNENLFEQCTIRSVKGNGGYGYGLWASPPEDGSHGPNGPRNVVYNCDVVSPMDSVWLGGMSENWIFTYNRFKAEKGPGIFVKTHSFDHIIKGNVFILKGKSPMVELKSPDCDGVEIIDNKLYGGNGKFCYGLGYTSIVSGNKAFKYDANAPRPNPAVKSIFEWQRKAAK